VSITDLERQQAHPALRIEQSKNDLLTLRMAIAREYRLAQMLFPTDVSAAISTLGQLQAGFSATPTNKWDTTSSNPDQDLKLAQLAMYGATGMLANVLVLPFPVAYNLATQHGADTFRGQMLYTVNGAGGHPPGRRHPAVGDPRHEGSHRQGSAGCDEQRGWRVRVD
jgi:hypothetical protein